MAVSLARADLFTGILQKLNHKKAVVRLNLLRIVRSICDPSENQTDGLRSHRLFGAIEGLAENDNAVLVRNMASELVKSRLRKEQDVGSSGRSRQGMARRQSSYTPPSLHNIPLTPTHSGRMSQSSAFIDGSVTPRRSAALPVPAYGHESALYRPRSRDGPGHSARSSAESLLYRPGSRERPASRDGPILTRRTSADSTNGSSLGKSRLPRTSLLRASKSSMAAPTLRDETPPPTPSSNRKENGVRLRDQARSAASPSSSTPQISSRRRTARQPSGEMKWS